MKIRHADGAVHFSQLKVLNQSPAHYKIACETPFEPTRDMRIGTCAHHLILGPREGKQVVCFDGAKRQGSKWQDYAEENRGREILTKPEWAEAEAIRDAVMLDPMARKYLEGVREKPLRWMSDGVECATDGIDVVGHKFIADLKITNCSKPERFIKVATNLFYHAQMAFYDEGAMHNGIDTSEGQLLIAVESKPPHCVVVYRLPPETMAQGRKSNAIWMEMLQRCEENDFWPGYVQNVVDFDLPPWMSDGGEDADDGDAGEVALA